MTSPSQQKLRVTGPTVVTANRLSDGKVIYRAAKQGWTTQLDAAAVVTTTEAVRELLAAAAREHRRGRFLRGSGRDPRRPYRARKLARAHPRRGPDIRAAGK